MRCVGRFKQTNSLIKTLAMGIKKILKNKLVFAERLSKRRQNPNRDTLWNMFVCLWPFSLDTEHFLVLKVIETVNYDHFCFEIYP